MKQEKPEIDDFEKKKKTLVLKEKKEMSIL